MTSDPDAAATDQGVGLLDGQAAERLASLRSGVDWASLLRQIALHPRLDLDAVLRDPVGDQLTGRRSMATGVPAGLTDVLGWLARRHGFTVVREQPDAAESTTDWRSRRIVMSPDLDLAETSRRMLHELGHVLLHRPADHPQGASTAICRGVRKIEADSVAFMVAVRLGLDTSRFDWPYIPSWAGSDPRARPEAAVLATASRAAMTAGTIIDHLDVALYGRSPTRARQTSTPAPGIADPEREPGEAANAELNARISRVLQDAEQFYLGRRDRSWVPGYLTSRGLSEDDIRRWRIGYAPAGWTTLIDHLRALGHDDALIEAAGLARKSSRGTLIDHFRDRVMLAIRDETGAIAGFIGRVGPTAKTSAPKYLNTPETAVFTKGSLLLGLHENQHELTRGAVPVIVEGPFDAIAITKAEPGRYVGLAPCGTALTARQVAALARSADVRDRLVLVALDADRAGREAAMKSYGLLSAVTTKLAAVSLPAGRDPADILQADGAAALAKLLNRPAEPLAQIVIDAHLERWETRIAHAEGQLNALRDLASFVASTLPAEVAEKISEITGGQQLVTMDEQMRPVAHPELAAIAQALPAGPICQIARIADRLGAEYSEVTAAVANAVTSSIARAAPARLTSRDFPRVAQDRGRADRGPPAARAQPATTARPARRTRR